MTRLVKNPCANAEDTRDTSLIPGLGRSTGKGNGTLIQCSCLENPMEGGARQATVHGVAESDMTKHMLSLSLSLTHTHTTSQLIYSVLLVSHAQQSGSVIYIYICPLFF